MMHDLLYAALILLLLIPVIIGVVFILKKLNPTLAAGRTDIQLLNQFALNKKEKIVVVAVENVKLVIGVTPYSLNLLHVIGQNEQ